MDSLNRWLWETFGDWVYNFWALWLIIAVALAIVLILTFIIVAVRHAQNKKKIAALQAKANGTGDKPDEAELRKQIREELEAEYKNKAPATENTATADAKITELNQTVEQKQKRIDELTAELEKAKNDKPDNGNLYRTINELNQKVKAQESEIAKLKGEGEAETTATKPKAAPKKAAKPVEPEPEEEEEDDEDDYYDDEYGDETSAVKVTLKFDRIRNNWVIMRSDSDRAYRRLATKQEALVIAKDLARRLHAQLAVHKKDGKFQKV